MKKLLLLIPLLVMCGCSLVPDNDLRISEYKKCIDAGMHADETGGGDIICIPPNEK